MSEGEKERDEKRQAMFMRWKKAVTVMCLICWWKERV